MSHSIDQHSQSEPAGEPSSLQLTSEDGKHTHSSWSLLSLSHSLSLTLSLTLSFSVVHAYDVTLRASKKREQELQEQLNALLSVSSQKMAVEGSEVSLN